MKVNRRGFILGSALTITQTSAGPRAGPNGTSNEVVMAFGAHPADVLFAAGGTLAKHASRGDYCIAVPLTLGVRHLKTAILRPDGSKRSIDEAKRFYRPMMDKACEILGIHFVTPDLKDSVLDVDLPQIKETVKIIRKFKPGIALTHHPAMPPLMGHPDHGNAGSLVLKAAMLAGEEGFEPQEDPHWIRNILYYASPVTIVVKNLGYDNYPNLYVSIDEPSADKKKQALLVMKEVMGFTHESIEASWKSTAQPDHPKVEAFTQVRPPVVEYLESYDSPSGWVR